MREDVFTTEFGIGHTQHEDALNKSDDFPGTACDEREENRNYPPGSFAEIEVLDSEASEKYGEKCCHSPALSLGATRIKRIVRIGVRIIIHWRRRRAGPCSGSKPGATICAIASIVVDIGMTNRTLFHKSHYIDVGITIKVQTYNFFK